jgi:hypothetical protein
MKKTLFFLLFSFAAFMTMAQTKVGQIQRLADSGSAIYYEGYYTTDTVDAHKDKAFIPKTGLQVQSKGNTVYLYRVTGGNVYGSYKTLSFNIKTDSIVNMSNVGFAVYHGDYGSTNLKSYLQGMLRSPYLNTEKHKVGTTTSFQIKSGRGVFGGFTIDSAASGTINISSVSFYDAATITDTSSGSLIGTWPTSTIQNIQLGDGSRFEKGLTIKIRNGGHFSIRSYKMEPELRLKNN